MDNAKYSDRQLVVNIITDAFKDNPSVLSVINNDKRKTERISALAEYVFDTAFSRNGIFISSDKTGVAICYRYNEKANAPADYFNQLKLVVNAIGIRRVFKILKRDAYISKQRPANGNFMYFWFFGVVDQGKGRGAAIELKNRLFEKAKKENLPIYLETSVLQNKSVYERFGFKVYHSWKEAETSNEIWFMKKDKYEFRF